MEDVAFFFTWIFFWCEKKRGAEKKKESESGVSSVACVFPAPLVNTRIHVLYGLQATPGHGVNVCYDRVWRDARDDCDDRYAGSTRAARQRSGEGREAGEAGTQRLI